MLRWGNISKFEKLIIAAVVFSAIFLAKFPTVHNASHTPSGYWYPRQTSWFDAWDTNFQVSYMRYGERRGVMLENTYTTSSHGPVFIYQYYTLLGVMNRLLHLDPFVLFHLASIVTSAILILTCYVVSALFFRQKIYRLSAFVMIVLGGGLGWLTFLPRAADYAIAGFTMVNAFERGHEALITLLLLWVFIEIYRYIKSLNKKNLILAGIASFIGVAIHPPFIALLVFVGVVLGVWMKRARKDAGLLKYALGLTGFFGVYSYIFLIPLLGNRGFAGVVGQNLFSANILSIALGFGALGIFILWEVLFDKERSEKKIFVQTVFFSQLSFVFLPVGFHLYFFKNMHVFGVLLGLWGLQNLISDKRWQHTILIGIVILSLFTRLHIFRELSSPNPNNSFMYLTKQEGDALADMSKLPPDSGVLSLYRMGNYIPAFSDTRVYYGHKFQTPDNAATLQKAISFYITMSEKEQRKFLQEYNITYIYYGLEEATYRRQANLPIANPFSYFPIIFQNDTSIIYQITKETTGETKK